MNYCDIVLYAGKNKKVVVKRQTINFNLNIYQSYVTGKIQKEDYDTFKMNTIEEYCNEFNELILNKALVNPQIILEYKSSIQEDDEISNDELVSFLAKTERDTNINTLSEKINKYFK